MSGFLGRRAIVIGAGMGGLSAAGALAGYFEQVDVLERDQVTSAAASRPGTPHDRHPHGLLRAGLQALNEIFPDYEYDLAAAGGEHIGVTQDMRFEREDFGVLPQRNFGIRLLCASRPLIESVLRRRVQALPNVTLHPQCRVTAITVAPEASAVRGVTFEGPSEQAQTLDADLVVDASGRGALSLAALDRLGWEPPAITEIGVELTYATAVVPIPSAAPKDWRLALSLPNPPHMRLHGILLPIEGRRWIALIARHGPGAPPVTWESFLEEVARLSSLTMYRALQLAEPPAEIRHFAFKASTWRHFERLPRLPRGLLPIADAFCRFNPAYGQGMSSAARQARLLQDALASYRGAADPIASAQAAFMAEIGPFLQTPWSLSTSADLAYPETQGERPENFAESREFEAALFKAAVVDPVVHRALIEVTQLLQPMSRLHEPDIMQRIEAAAARATRDPFVVKQLA
ncbi:MAG TPA: FAD-dependent monooxygenase [Dongiaceae bacterium]|nr:FAD-dependent monooxygenase [Dongiaceae bacterium]